MAAEKARPAVVELARRSVLAWVVLGLAACRSPRPARAPDPHIPSAGNPSWEAFKTAFLTAEGRIVDPVNGGISHSEGQGYGMLLAEAANDPSTFARIWNWTHLTLSRDDGHLFAWRYDPNSSPQVTDTNNATDADLLIAWALSRAAQRWHAPDYATVSAQIRGEILRRLVIKFAGYRLLLPALQGYQIPHGWTVNLSYYVFPALVEFEQLEPRRGWHDLLFSGLRLLRAARFGAHRLPPDWLAVTADGSLAPAAVPPAHFGYDAIRIALYLVWAGIDRAEYLEPFRTYWSPWRAPASPPAWVDLRDDTPAPYPLPPGLRAIAALACADKPLPPEIPVTGADYYSAVLSLLAELARAQRQSTPNRL